jgi:hypothetical protein
MADISLPASSRWGRAVMNGTRRATRTWVQLALAEAEIVTQRSEKVRHQGGGLMRIGGIRLAELGTHPLFLHAELGPEHEEY